MITSLLVALVSTQSTLLHQSDAVPLYDVGRPVSKISRNGFVLEYFTASPCETRAEVRQGEVAMTSYGHKPDGTLKVVEGSSTKSTWHTLNVSGLQPGKRYFYRVWDPEAKPTTAQVKWGAAKGWRREYAVSTQAAPGRKTVIRIPVKVLLMPNVINVESGYANPNVIAPLPPRISAEELAKVKAEFAVSSRVFWVSSGMRYWVDYQIVIDDRWQRWGAEVPTEDDFYKGWPICRSYANQDFQGAGGGDFTIVDPKNPSVVSKSPVLETKPYCGQIELAWPRRWNARSKAWEFYSSGGGTFGVDDLPAGFPGRSQFFVGSDVAWLASHEFHHQMESQAQFWLSDREDDRISFDHPAPRRRVLRGDGTAEETTWSTNGRHGEHWDVLAFWDRTLTDAQWLRCYFGETITVEDKDEDGVPDNDPRLPLDELRFGSSPLKSKTDGEMNDLAKIMLANWAPGPLQSSWTKPPFAPLLPSPTKADTNGNGIPDAFDANPLVRQAPVIPAKRMSVTGPPTEWSDLPIQGALRENRMTVVFKHAHDDVAYYGHLELHGNWKHVAATFDGEGLGVYSGIGVLGFDASNGSVGRSTAGPKPPLVEIKPAFGGIPGFRSNSVELPDGGVSFTFSFQNRGEGPWYWKGGGREIGVVINAFDQDGRAFTLWEPYRPLYCKMLEPNGRYPMPDIKAAPMENATDVYLPGDKRIKTSPSWVVSGASWHHQGANDALLVAGQNLHDFDFQATIEAKSDAVLGAFSRNNKTLASEGYVGFVGGYGNTTTRLRFFGSDETDEPVLWAPGRHEVQMSRREGQIRLFVDGKIVGIAADPSPKLAIDRVGVLGGFGGAQTVYEIRLRKTGN